MGGPRPVSYTHLVLTRLCHTIQNKQQGLLSCKILLLPNNARPHAAHATGELLANSQWEIFKHPPYSPDPVSYTHLDVYKRQDGWLVSITNMLTTAQVICMVYPWLSAKGINPLHAGIIILRWKSCWFGNITTWSFLSLPMFGVLYFWHET